MTRCLESYDVEHFIDTPPSNLENRQERNTARGGGGGQKNMYPWYICKKNCLEIQFKKKDASMWTRVPFKSNSVKKASKKIAPFGRTVPATAIPFWQALIDKFFAPSRPHHSIYKQLSHCCTILPITSFLKASIDQRSWVMACPFYRVSTI